MNSYKKIEPFADMASCGLPQRQATGARFIPENGGGAGVKLKRSPPAAQLRDGEAGVIDSNEM